MPKKTALLPLTIEALTKPVEDAAGKATTWTVRVREIIDQVDEIEKRRVALKLSKKDCIGIEAIYLTDTPRASAYKQKSRTVIGSKVTYRYTRDGWKVVSIKREDRWSGEPASIRLAVAEALIPVIRQRAVADLIVRKAA